MLLLLLLPSLACDAHKVSGLFCYIAQKGEK